MRRYAAPDDDNGRWEGFPFRAGDIVVSTRSKSGTTWMQMICALLVFGTPELPRPLADISPWLDHLVEPREAVVARLEAQEHRRILKTHTPLDGLPLDPRATYIVVARHPLDMAVSLYYQRSNLDRHRLSELTGQPVRADLAEPPPLTVWLSEWVRSRATPVENLDSPAGVLHHVRDAWRRRGEPNVVLVHFRRPARRPVGTDAWGGRAAGDRGAGKGLARPRAGGDLPQHEAAGEAPRPEQDG
jgi:hypothetical protein